MHESLTRACLQSYKSLSICVQVGDDSFGHNTVQNFKDNKIEVMFNLAHTHNLLCSIYA